MEIVEEEVFFKWKEEVNDEYPGKGKALFQVALALLPFLKFIGMKKKLLIMKILKIIAQKHVYLGIIIILTFLCSWLFVFFLFMTLLL